ncbi:co-chaperone DjlA [Candidatus Rariloculus sp.]|uniref:co-chaperone DjlA n=1 Tax=Candidatus Rariloculus sp. TaxID=3101265 RepID=UPI003D112118
MQWIGKVVGATLGLAVAGPFGSILGAFVGHQFDRGMVGRIAGWAAPGRTPQLFFEVTFEVMGHLAKSGGRVSEEEVRVARRIMHGMKLTPEQVQTAIERFTAGKHSRYPITDRLAELKSGIAGRRDLTRAFLEIQLQAAIGSGEIENPKRRMLWQVANGLGVGRVQFAQIEALIRAHMNQSAGPSSRLIDLDAAYRVLGVDPNATDKDVKTAYRRLMNQHHPDKLVARGLPESMVGLAEQKTHEIRAAYDRVKSHRDFK